MTRHESGAGCGAAGVSCCCACPAADDEEPKNPITHSENTRHSVIPGLTAFSTSTANCTAGMSLPELLATRRQIKRA